MARVILCRHGETKLNKSEQKGDSNERIRGWLDVPLDDKGRDQAEALGLQLSDRPIYHVYTSPLLRARDTGRTIASHVGVPMSLDKALLPWNLGQFSGRRVSEVLPEMKRLSTPEYENEPAPHGEPFSTFRNRFLNYLSNVLDKSKQTGRTYALVAHTRNLQLARAWEKAGRPADLSYDPKTMNDYEHEKGPGNTLELDPERGSE